MYHRDTIAAIATPVGSGGIGIIRLSGPESFAILSRIFRSTKFNPSQAKSHRLYPGILFDPADGSDLDQALACCMRAPHSYTGEEVVEINCHSGLVLLNKILLLSLAAGARLAEPGEFTRRAFLNGRIDLTRAEAVIDVIEAKTETGLKIASRQLTGKLAQCLDQFRNGLISIIAIVEAAIDFPDDDILLAPAVLTAQVLTIANETAAILETYHEGCLYKYGVQTVIAGKPNVGKSSLLNALLGDERALVTAYPGTTRDSIEDTITINGIPVRLVDTAGLHHSDHAIELLGMERARLKISQADIILLVLDSSRPLDMADHALVELVADKQFILVRNKIDMPASWDEGEFQNFPPTPFVAEISALNHTGIEMVRETLGRMIGSHPNLSSSEILITNARHHSALKKFHSSLLDAATGLQSGLSPELLAVDLHTALDALGDISGTTTADDILETIFSRFCIGK